MELWKAAGTFCILCLKVFHTENTSWETLHIQPPPIIPWMVIQFHKFLVGPKEQLH